MITLAVVSTACTSTSEPVPVPEKPASQAAKPAPEPTTPKTTPATPAKPSAPTSEPASKPAPPTTPAAFEVISIDITPPQATVGDPVRITAEVRNTGGREDIYVAILTVDGVEIEAKEVAVGAGDTQMVAFSLVEDEVGTYRIAVGELSSSLMVIARLPASLKGLEVVYPEMVQELLKLPDLKAIEAKDAEAIEDIAHLASAPEYKPAFESMLNEGIKDKRKYCTPLQALLWIAYDREFEHDNPLMDYSLTKLIDAAWKNTTTSENYDSERWQDFDEVVDRLNSPLLVNAYMKDNFSYGLYEGKGSTRTPEQTFNNKLGVCLDWARFALHNLLQNGYSYDNFDVHEADAACILHTQTRNETTGHVVCLYVEKGDFYTIDYGQFHEGIKGPFPTVQAAAEATNPRLSEYRLDRR